MVRLNHVQMLGSHDECCQARLLNLTWTGQGSLVCIYVGGPPQLPFQGIHAVSTTIAPYTEYTDSLLREI